MSMKENRIRRMLNDGGCPLGIQIMEFGTRGIAKILEYGSVDYVIIDMEHSGFGIERVADLIAWFKATDIAPIVRVPENLYHFLAGVMDAGAAGVQVANVETADQARQIVQAIKYAPMGNRGLGLTAAHSDFRTPKADEYLPFMNRRSERYDVLPWYSGAIRTSTIARRTGTDRASASLALSASAT
jgi:2-keto-3-deoxy-L-rhamnonate aldolase RhmA